MAPTVDQAVTFDGSSSICSRCTFTWEDDGTDGSGGTQWPLGTGKVLTFTFSAAGTKLVRLRVTDRFGRTASTMKSIIVAAVTTPPPPPPSGSCDRTANSAATLSSELVAAQSGTICLASGDYGTFTGAAKSAMVTVTPLPGASVSMAVAFGSTASNIRLDGIQNLSGWDINGSKNIEIVNSTFKSAMQVRGATAGIVFDNDTFYGLSQGTWEGRLSFGQGARDAIVRNSSFGNGGCSDGIQLTGDASNVTIQNNTFTGIRQGSCAQHADPIQLYGASDIKVLSNYFYNNSTGIMSPDSNGSPITIKNNVWIMDEYPWAYVGGGTFDSTITHNVVVGGSLNLTVGNQSTTSRNTIVRDNVSDVIIAGTGNSVDHNLLPGGVTFLGGSGRCSYALSALSNGRNAASDGTDIGLNDCSASPPGVSASASARTSRAVRRHRHRGLTARG